MNKTRLIPILWLLPFALAWTSASVAAPASLSALSAIPAAQAQTSATRRAMPADMRLWSFGDCDRQFPYSDTEEHANCVKTVGSEEARDARAFDVCDRSHEKDSAEAARCKEAYRANRDRAVQQGLVPNATAHQVAPSAAMMEKVKAIAAAAVEQDGAPARTVSPVASEPPRKRRRDDEGWTGVLENWVAPGMGGLALLLIGWRVRQARRQRR